MYHRSNKYPPNSLEWRNSSVPGDPEPCKKDLQSNLVATQVPPLLPSTLTATRFYPQAKVSPGLQILFLATSLLFSPASLAEHADRDKPLILEADQVLIDDMHNTSTFSGNVRLAQGTMLIRGDRIEVMRSGDGFQQTKAYGNTASFRQKREGSEEYMEGYGERIEYDTRTGTVDFYGQARVKRELDEVRGDHITYSMKTETFQVSGGTNSTSTEPKRVRAVLQPRPKPEASVPSSKSLPDGTSGKSSSSRQ